MRYLSSDFFSFLFFFLFFFPLAFYILGAVLAVFFTGRGLSSFSRMVEKKIFTY